MSRRVFQDLRPKRATILWATAASFTLGGIDQGLEGRVLADPSREHQGTLGLFDDGTTLHSRPEPGDVAAGPIEVPGHTDDGFPDCGVDLEQRRIEIAEIIAVDAVQVQGSDVIIGQTKRGAEIAAYAETTDRGSKGGPAIRKLVESNPDNCMGGGSLEAGPLTGPVLVDTDLDHARVGVRGSGRGAVRINKRDTCHVSTGNRIDCPPTQLLEKRGGSGLSGAEAPSQLIQSCRDGVDSGDHIEIVKRGVLGHRRALSRGCMQAHLTCREGGRFLYRSNRADPTHVVGFS